MPIAPENITYTEKDMDDATSKSYENGLREAINIIDSEIPNNEGHAYLLLAMQNIENKILKMEIDRLSAKIEEMQEKIIRYEKG